MSLTSGQTYNLTLTGHATANTQMKILGVYESDGTTTTKVHEGASAGKYSSSVSVQFTPRRYRKPLRGTQLRRSMSGCVGKMRKEASRPFVQCRPSTQPPDYTFTVVED